MGNNTNTAIRLAPSNEEVDDIRNIPYITDKIKNELMELHARGDNTKEVIMYGIASLSIFLEADMSGATINKISVIRPHLIPNIRDMDIDALSRKLLNGHLPDTIRNIDMITYADIIQFGTVVSGDEFNQYHRFSFAIVRINHGDTPFTVIPFLNDTRINM